MNETMSQDKFAQLLQFFKVIGNESRLKIVGILANREATVGDLADLLDLREPTVSHHLGLLRMGELVNTRRNGKEIFYSLRNVERDKSGRALQDLLNGARCIRLGPLVLGRAES